MNPHTGTALVGIRRQVTARRVLVAATIGAAALLGFLSTYRLTESPPIWFDEGHIVQIAMNAAGHSPHALLQVAPGVYESGAFSATTGYTVTFPVAAAFKLFGMDLLVARSVMVIFILLFAVCAWRLMRYETSPPLAAYSLWLIATFAPLYGNGKNVLGEVPGLLYLAAFLLLVKRIESRQTSWFDFFGAGLFLGFALVTKPVFFLLIPPVLAVLLFSRGLLTVPKVFAALTACSAAVLLWIWVQFGGQTVAQTIHQYLNPFAIDTVATIPHNAFLFVSSPQPLYALMLLGIWVSSVVLRVWRGGRVSRAEYIAVGFACMTYLAFLRINPYYRYFFLGEILAVAYLPQALFSVWPRKIPKYAAHSFLVLLIMFQAYQCFLSSWVATYYTSQRSTEVAGVMSSISASTSVFAYNVPEIPLFLPVGVPYYQYLFITPAVIIGEEQLSLIADGVPDIIVIGENPVPAADLYRYKKTRSFNRYELWQRK